MWPQLLYDLVCTARFLRGKEGIVENPIVLFSVFVIDSKQIHRGIQHFQHPVAPLNALCSFFNIISGQIGSCSIDGIKEFIHTCPIFQPELCLHLVDYYFQAIGGIPISPKKFIGIMKARPALSMRRAPLRGAGPGGAKKPLVRRPVLRYSVVARQIVAERRAL